MGLLGGLFFSSMRRWVPMGGGLIPECTRIGAAVRRVAFGPFARGRFHPGRAYRDPTNMTSARCASGVRASYRARTAAASPP